MSLPSRDGLDRQTDKGVHDTGPYQIETNQTDRQTEAKTETRRGVRREEDVMGKTEPETENLAETAKDFCFYKR